MKSEATTVLVKSAEKADITKKVARNKFEQTTVVCSNWRRK